MIYEKTLNSRVFCAHCYIVVQCKNYAFAVADLPCILFFLATTPLALFVTAINVVHEEAPPASAEILKTRDHSSKSNIALLFLSKQHSRGSNAVIMQATFH